MALTFDGIDLKSNFNFIVTDVKGRGLPPVVRDEVEMDRIDGSYINSERYDKRDISITGIVYDSTNTGARKKKDNLLRLLSTSYAADKVLGFPESQRGIFVRLSVGDATQFTHVGPYFNTQVYEIQLKFTSYVPFFFPLSSPPDNTNYVPRNLLSYGNFEMGDSETDVALGWTRTHSGIRASFISGVVDEYAQKLYLNNTTGAQLNVGITQEVNGLHQEEVLYIAGYLKRLSVSGQPTAAPKIMCVFDNDTGEEITDVDESTSGGTANITGNVQYEWLKVSDKITIPYNATKMTVNVVQTTNIAEVSMFAVDAVQVNNISLLGFDIQDMTASQLDDKLPFTCLEG